MQQQNYSVGIYVRLSKDDERAGESVSIEYQKLMLRKYVMEQGWDEVGCYVDDGYSGTNLERPGIQRLLEDAKDGRVNLILVKDMSRLGRNYIEVGRLTDYVFPMIGCRFIALNDGVDSINSDNDIAPFRNLFNEFHSRDTSKKIKAVKQACAKNGMFLGCYAPYGYKKDADDKHRLIIDEPAAEVVRKIFALRCKGLGFRKIAGLLNEEGLPNPKDYYYQGIGRPNPIYSNHLWNDVTIRVIIRNEAYIGHMVQNKTGKMSYKSKKCIDKPRDEWIKVEGTHEPVIDMDIWNLCVQLDQKNVKPRSTKKGAPSLFSGLVRCMDCGFMMRCNQESLTKKDGTVSTYVSYFCGNYARSGRSACSAHIIYQQPLEELVLEDIRRYTGRILEDEDGLRQELKTLKDNDSAARQKADRAQQKTLQVRLNDLERLTRSLYEDKVLGSVPNAVFKNLMQGYEQERQEKAAALEETECRLAESVQNDRDVESFLSAVKKYVALESLDREMLLELVDYIEVGERLEGEGKQKYRDITIHYQFMGAMEGPTTT
ncbi:MAG: recombinase family protein [Firmicutes bacterium]|nr:recombinase family protein [Bacillota bacterium]